METPLKTRTGHTLWRIDPPWRERVIGSDAPDWFELGKDPRATCVKCGFQRRTWRVELEEKLVYAKIARLEGGLARWSTYLGLSAGQREWRTSRRAESRGVAVAHCIAIGIDRGAGRRTALLSEGIERAVPLTDAWKNRWTHSGRHESNAVIEAVARLFVSAHESGFIHRDGHPNNIIVHPTASGEKAAAFIDVALASITKGPAPYTAIVRALAQLDHAFMRRATRAQRLRFLRRYLELLGVPHSRREERWLEHRIVPAIDDARSVHAARLARRRDRRIFRDGKYFARLSLSGGWQAQVALRLGRRHVFPEAQIPDRTQEDWSQILKPALSAWQYDRAATIGADSERLKIRIDIPGGLLARLAWTMNGSPLRRLFVRCHRLRHRDLAAPPALAYLQHRTARGLIDAAGLVYANDNATKVSPARPVR